MSKLCSSTFFWAASMRRDDHAALDRLARLHAELGEDAWRPIRRRRRASDRLAATGRIGSNRDRLAGRPGRAAGCRCGGLRAVRCRRCAGRPSSATSRPSSSIFSLALDVVDGLLPHVIGHVEAGGVFVLEAGPRRASPGLPPRMMSVPRPAMLVAMVTAPMRPAWATISASRAAYSGLAFSSSCLTPRRCSILLSFSRLGHVGGADEDRPALALDLDRCRRP